MRVTPVDPRDMRWEKDVDLYRVYFWSSDGGHVSEQDVAEVEDVDAVLSWAARKANGRVVEVFACMTCDGQPGLVRLAGRRPDTG